MKHEMILLDADLRTVHARLSQRFREQQAEREQAAEDREGKHEHQQADHGLELVEF